MLKVVHIKQRKKNPIKDPLITKSITVHRHRTWTLRVHDKVIQHFDGKELEILTRHTEIITSGQFFEILYTVDTAKVCLGNPDFEEIGRHLSCSIFQVRCTCRETKKFHHNAIQTCVPVHEIQCPHSQVYTISRKETSNFG